MVDVPVMSQEMMTLLGLIGLWLYSIVLVLPCWIIACRTKQGGRWWNWIFPLWNLYAAFKLGKGLIKPSIVILVLILLAGVSLPFKDNPYVFVFISVASMLSLLIFFYVFYLWLREISILADVHPSFLPMVMLVIPTLLAVFVVVLVMQQMLTLEQADFVEDVVGIATWVVFLIVALRTPKAKNQNLEFQLDKE